MIAAAAVVAAVAAAGGEGLVTATERKVVVVVVNLTLRLAAGGVCDVYDLGKGHGGCVGLRGHRRWGR